MFQIQEASDGKDAEAFVKFSQTGEPFKHGLEFRVRVKGLGFCRPHRSSFWDVGI